MFWYTGHVGNLSFGPMITRYSYEGETMYYKAGNGIQFEKEQLLIPKENIKYTSDILTA